MDGKTIATGLAGLATTVASIVIPEMLPADPATKELVLHSGLAFSGLLYLFAAILWLRGRGESDARVASRLARKITEAINTFHESGASFTDLREQGDGSRQYEIATRRLMEKYRTEYQGEVIVLLRKLQSRGEDVRRLERIAEHPTNPLGIEQVARELSVIANGK